MKSYTRRLGPLALLLSAAILSSCSLLPMPNYDPVITLSPEEDSASVDPIDVKISGSAATKTGTSLNMLVDWERTRDLGGDSLSITAYLLSELLVIPSEKNKGVITINGEPYEHSPMYELVDVNDPVHLRMILATMTVSVPTGQAVDVTVTWPLNIEYNGKQIGDLKVAFTVE